MNAAGTRPYRRRRRGPVVAVVSVLAGLAVVTWTTVLLTAGGAAAGASCPAPPSGRSPGQVLPADALDGTTPTPPSAAKVRVLNAGGQRGQANLVAAQLAEYGFEQAAAPANDPLYPDGDMQCVGQIRFGRAGSGTATTVSLLLPCVELVRDARADDTVDVAVGTAFGDVNPGRAARAVLDALGSPAGAGDGSGGTAQTPQPVDKATLAAAQQARCG